jgi:hypothetical protein
VVKHDCVAAHKLCHLKNAFEHKMLQQEVPLQQQSEHLSLLLTANSPEPDGALHCDTPGKLSVQHRHVSFKY